MTAGGNKSNESQLTRATLLAFSAPALPIAMMHVPAAAVIPGFYASHTGISLATIGSIFLATRIFDAVSDPMIGYWSDRSNSRFGKRKPWLVVGALISAIAVYFLFTPPPTAGGLWLLVCFLSLYFGWTVMEIPYRAWSAELSDDYGERTRISTYIAVFGVLGAIAFMGVPLLPVFETSEIGSDTLLVMALLIIALLIPLVGIAVWRVDEGEKLASGRTSIKEALKAFRTNVPFRIFAGAYIFGGLANGLFVALFYIYVDSYLMIGAQFAILYLCNALSNLLSVPIWYRVMGAIGKHRALALSWLFYGLLLPAMVLTVKPGADAFIPMIGFAIAIGFSEGAIRISPFALVGDIADYDLMKSGANRVGSYFALLIFVAKMNFAVGGAVGFLILGWVGYQVRQANDGLADGGLFWAIAGIPAILYALAALLIYRYPLTAERHARIQKIIVRQRARRDD